MAKLKNALAIIVVLLVVYYLFTLFFRTESWDLMICDTRMGNDIECQGNEYVLKGYKTQVECKEKGISLAREKGFECGMNCKEDNGALVCEKICNSAGCFE